MDAIDAGYLMQVTGYSMLEVKRLVRCRRRTPVLCLHLTNLLRFKEIPQYFKMEFISIHKISNKPIQDWSPAPACGWLLRYWDIEILRH